LRSERPLVRIQPRVLVFLVVSTVFHKLATYICCHIWFFPAVQQASVRHAVIKDLWVFEPPALEERWVWFTGLPGVELCVCADKRKSRSSKLYARAVWTLTKEAD